MRPLLLLCTCLIAANTHAQSTASLPVIIEKHGRHALLVDGKPFLILGGQCHNSSAWAAMLPKVWQAIEAMHANTLETPIYWEQLEPRQGEFDFSVVDTLLAQARAHGAHLVLLWFATWKNGSNHYMPEWMKENASLYPNVTGKDGRPVDSPSPDAKAAQEADTKAFAALMRHLKQVDAVHTVLMVQVENEAGAWGSVRDYAAGAQRSFEGPVPAELLKPALLKALGVPVVSAGTWQQVFGKRADEYFQAWSVAHYIGRVAAAGKAEYPLPLYANAALRDPLTNPEATNYESGGPTDNVLPIWKVAAPALDILAPDIYLPGSERVLKVIDLYNRPDNALFVPEAGLIHDNVKYLYATLGNSGIGFSPFGIDDNTLAAADTAALSKLEAYGQEYAALAPMMREVAQWAFEGKLKAVVEHEDHAAQTLDFEGWQANVGFGGGRSNTLPGNPKTDGKAMIAHLDQHTFILMGTGCRVSFSPLGNNAGKAWQYLKVEEGSFVDGQFQARRILNGDETDWGGPQFGSRPTVLRATLVVR